MAFTPRLVCPDAKNKAYVKTTYGGLNHAILGNANGRLYEGSVMPNCVGYCKGRGIEIVGEDLLPNSNAENWWATKDNFSRGQTPKVGSVMCWRKGKAGVSSDGAGHVAFVEEVNSKGDVVVSESGWTGTKANGRYWRLRTLKRVNGTYALGVNYFFQGFIYVVEEEAAKTVPVFRLYNKKGGGMHTFTVNVRERDELVRRGWYLEDVAWRAPEHSEVPVFSIYNENNGDHLLTIDAEERNKTLARGLVDEGIEFYSDTKNRVPVYRAYNQNTGEHFYTADAAEYTQLRGYGWKGEGVAFYAASKG